MSTTVAAPPPAAGQGAEPRSRSWLLWGGAAAVAIAAACWIARTAKEGDADVYFSYFKNFFDLPFSHAPGVVAFGASGPLHVALNAPLQAILGSHFVGASQILAALLLAGSVWWLWRARPLEPVYLLVLALLVTFDIPLVLSSSELYETALAVAALSLLYYALARERVVLATVTAGLLHLIRPELALVTAVTYVYLFVRSDRRLRYLAIAAAASLPVVLYYGYMLAQTGGVVPSSVFARVQQARETDMSWASSMWHSFGKDFLSDQHNSIYPLGGVAVVLALFRLGWRTIRLELMLLVACLVPFVVQPPLGYTARYLVIATPFLSIVAVRVLRSFHVRLLVAVACAVLALGSIVELHKATATNLDYDTLLLRDLAGRLHPLSRGGDRVLLYEIQGQYYLHREGISADGIVGTQMHRALLGDESWSTAVRRHRIRFVVTVDAFAYRRVYEGTLLARLYAHDLTHPVGSKFRADGLTLTKVLTNPQFADPGLYDIKEADDLNFGRTERVYGAGKPAWRGLYPMWNSVYRVGP
jgi:hypothetical protein